MKSEKKKKNGNKSVNVKILIAFIFGAIISITSSYAIAETLIKSADVSYVDNSRLGATNVQAAIDGTCTKFSNDLATLLDKMYPIGSIYISTTLSTPSQVGSAIGGTWESYGQGRTLVGVGKSDQEYKINSTGGESTHKLTVDEMPSHTHQVTATGTVSSTFTGKTVYTDFQGNHVHRMSVMAAADNVFENNTTDLFATGGKMVPSVYGMSGISTEAGSHQHTVTADGTVSSTFTGTPATTDSKGKGNSFNNLQPYITVYMYRRTK